jgi:hypothetical protein
MIANGFFKDKTAEETITLLYDSVEVKDISLMDYIQVRHAVYLPHTAGRYAKKQFKKAQMPIVERLVDRCGKIALQEFYWSIHV